MSDSQIGWAEQWDRWHRHRHATGGDSDVDAAERYDTPDTGMSAPGVLGPTVERLAELRGMAERTDSSSEPAEWPFLWPPRRTRPEWSYRS